MGTTLAPGSEQAVVVKRAEGAAAGALEAEGRRLRAAAHPGVVEVVSSTGTDEAWELRLVHAGRPLSVVGALDAERVAGMAAAVATTLADLHDMGIVHGHLDATHVLLGRQGRPVLCGFGAGPGPDGSPAGDVAALGQIVLDLLAGADDGEPLPEKRWRRRPQWAGWTRRSLLTLADQACAEPATRRPTARRLAAAVTEAVPGAALAPAPVAEADDEADDEARDPLHRLRPRADEERRRPPRLAAWASAAAGVALVLVGAVQLAPGGGSVALPAAPPSTTAATVVPTSATTTTTTRPPAAALVVGNTVSFAGERFEVGRAGDVVAVGDWRCTGPTPALLRPSTGEVFVFPSWATAGDLVVPATQVVPGAVALTVGAPSSSAGCATLLVQRRDGSAVPVAGARES